MAQVVESPDTYRGAAAQAPFPSLSSSQSETLTDRQLFPQTKIASPAHRTLPNPPRGSDEIVQSARDALKEADEDIGWNTTRLESAEDHRFYGGDQWPANIRTEREDNDRPVLTIPKIRRFVHMTIGEWRQNRISLRVRPEDEFATDRTAEVFEGLLRDIEYQSVADLAYATALSHAVIGGFGWLRVALERSEDDPWDLNIRIRPVWNPFSIFIDPLCMDHFLENCRYVMSTDWISREQAEKLYPGKVLTDVVDASGDTDIPWVDFGMDLVRVAEYWWRERYKKEIAEVVDDRGVSHDVDLTAINDKEWIEYLERKGAIKRRVRVDGTRIKMALVSGADVLWGPTTWPGRYFPFVPVYGEAAMVNGSRFLSGLVRHAKDVQRMYNIWRSHTTEILALQPRVPFVGPKGFMGEGSQRTAWEDSHKTTIAALEYDGDVVPQRAAPPIYPTGIGQESEVLTEDMKEVVGLHDPSLGERKSDQSGKAIIALQQQGSYMTSTYPDNLKHAVHHIGKIGLDLFPAAYNRSRVVRVLGEDRETVTHVGINGAQVRNGEGILEETHLLGRGRYGIVVTSGPPFATRRMESFASMLEWSANLSPQERAIVNPVMLRQADWPGADEMADALEQMSGQGPITPELLQTLQQMVMQVAPSPQELEKLILEVMRREHQRIGLTRAA